MTEHDLPSPIDDDQIAEPWRRLAGFAADWVVLVLIALIVVRVFRIDLDTGDALRLPPAVLITQGLVAAAYYIGFTVSRGQTPGKMLAGTRVVMERTGQIPGPGPSSLRWVVPGVFVFLPGVSVVAAVIYGWLLFDKRRRGLHDKAAKTVVVLAR
ncbi:MAG: hypothetical protein BMS9Abin07_0298 [Acidimicrobiia bacterium]|nr:MAG: hypothetical protein BMS9Abin07_0298 [Acidimicrobiia bacterium]